MWRMKFSIFANLWRLQGLLEHLHRIAGRPDIYSEQEGYDYVRYIAGLMCSTGFIKTTGFGMENLPNEGGYVLYPNHQGKYDAYGIVAAHDKALSIVMDREKSYYPLVDEIISVLNGKRMDLNDTRQSVTIIRQIAEEVAQGRRYIIFPEGAYSNDKHNTLWDFKPGCFRAATIARAPIVPVALVDSYKAYNSWQITPVKTQVHYLKPLTYEDYKDLNAHQISAIVKERIQAKLDELNKK
ncbi:MAG: 1-acyl-sn-glycerol-3-phosphate acyltransferase [Clostridia bacterium]|nr:1-acyl-sn-glycerol-3-phosphate acyltransferase [Clostridia bacterium]